MSSFILRFLVFLLHLLLLKFKSIAFMFRCVHSRLSNLWQRHNNIVVYLNATNKFIVFVSFFKITLHMISFLIAMWAHQSCLGVSLNHLSQFLVFLVRKLLLLFETRSHRCFLRAISEFSLSSLFHQIITLC